MGSPRAAKVAIIGGGCAAITTAFELSRPELRGQYDITVYQLGWRLGGKGASGRGPSGRIEEHGLHIWLGFYDNAFRLLRECYEELAADPQGFDVSDWREAFIPEQNIGLSARGRGEDWHVWSAAFPPQPGLPGDPVTPGELLGLSRYVSRAIDLVVALIRSVDSRREGAPAEESPATLAGRMAAFVGDPERIRAFVSDVIGGAISATAAVLVEALAVLQAGLKLLPSPLSSPLTDLAEWIARSLRLWFERTLIAEPQFLHIWETMDIVIATVVGVLRFGLLTDPRGLDAINDYESRDWLRLNGASEQSLQSPYVVGLYNLAFSYEGGDKGRPSIAAGQALRGALRMFFGYRGALFWRMRAGMGDIIFAPFYEALRRRGVKFEFFHKLTDVRLPDPATLQPGERPYVTALEFDVQAEMKDNRPFDPLVRVKGKPCWPATPDFSQLVDGDRMAAEGWDFESHWDKRRVATKRLEVGRDFDFVVLGVSVGALPYVCREILETNPRWRKMSEAVATTATQAFQIWLDHDLPSLGMKGAAYIGTAFADPFDTWCDMAHTVPEEGWETPPKTVVYFCSALADGPDGPDMDDPQYPERRREEVRRNAVGFLRHQAWHLWPKAYDPSGEFRWDMLVDGNGTVPGAAPADADRFATQYWTANINPTDRYVLTLPGSLKHRISPLDMSYDNMTIAGDWTDCGFNEGCVEAAVMSGRLAAHAIAGAPLLEDIVGYDHP